MTETLCKCHREPMWKNGSDTYWCAVKGREKNLKRSFGLTSEEYDAMLVKQGAVCGICGQACGTGRRLAVDHNHETGEIRGLLCAGCNRAVGWLESNRERALEWLR